MHACRQMALGGNALDGAIPSTLESLTALL
jgi:hypothetical protein